MIIFLFGKDSYQSRQKLKEVIDQYQKKHQSGLNLLKFGADGFDLTKFRSQVLAVSMFAEKKLVVCDDFLTELNQDQQDNLLRFFEEVGLKDNSNTVVIFYESGAPDKKLKLFQFLIKNSQQWQNFELLTGSALESWIKQEVIQQGAEIEPAAVVTLANNVGSDLWRQHQEIAKLSVYVAKDEIIKWQEVDLLVDQRGFDNDIFKTIEALGRQDKKTVLRLVLRHLDNGDDPLYLLSMFIYQWRNLLQLKDLMARRVPYGALAKRSMLHPFVVRKTVAQLNDFSLEVLKKNYQFWQDLELVVKSGAVDAKQALVNAVLTI